MYLRSFLNEEVELFPGFEMNHRLGQLDVVEADSVAFKNLEKIFFFRYIFLQ
jgi:hypothetical protein